jgi:anti-sigma B factor antagonist
MEVVKDMTSRLISPVHHIITVEGALRVPIDAHVMRRVHAVLRDGVRRVRLDLSRLSSIDAAGVGELVSVFNATKAAGGVLDISHASRRVRRILEVTGVYALLTPYGAAAVCLDRHFGCGSISPAA